MGSLAIHRPLKVSLDSFPFGGTRISVLESSRGAYVLRLHVHYHQTFNRRREG